MNKDDSSPRESKPAASKISDVYKAIDKGLKPVDELSKWHGRYELLKAGGPAAMALKLLGGAIAAIATVIASVLSWLTESAVSYLHVLAVTAPLTLAVIVLVLIYRSGEMNALGYLLTTIAVLIGATFLSKLVGPAIDWDFPAGHFDRSGSFQSVPIYVWPIEILTAFFHVYHAGPFLASVITGATSGLWLSKKISA